MTPQGYAIGVRYWSARYGRSFDVLGVIRVWEFVEPHTRVRWDNGEEGWLSELKDPLLEAPIARAPQAA